MPADLDLHIRTAETWDTAQLVDAMTAALEQTPIAWWLHPAAANRAPSVRDHLRHLAAQATVRVVDHQGDILAGAAWTTCANGEHPQVDITVPGHSAHPHRAARLHTLLTRAHPDQPHQHLLLIAVRAGRQRHGLGTSLLTDTPPDQAPLPCYTVLPATLTDAARHAGYQSTGPPITLTDTITLQPLHREPISSPRPPRDVGHRRL